MDSSLELAPGRIADASGALYLEATATVMIADAHLGYGWAQRRRGQMGPTTDGGIRARLLDVVRRFAPLELVFLGDTVHAPRPSAAEREFVEEVLGELAAMAKLVVVEGNHDRAFQRDFGHMPVEVRRDWEHDGVIGLHGDKLHLELPEARHYLLGHLHPAIKLEDDAGVKRRVPAFLVGQRATVLPAFSPFAAGFDVSEGMLPREVHAVLGPHDVVVVTGRRIARLPSKTNRSARGARG